MGGTRPASIVWFERLYIASLVIPMVLLAAVAAQGWDLIRTGAVPLGFLVGGLALGFVLPLALVLLVSHRRSVVAKWLLIAVFAIEAIATVPDYRSGNDLDLSLVALIVTAMQAVAILRLFSGSARAWLAGRPGPELGQTFE
jgi:hypothetical protein